MMEFDAHKFFREVYLRSNPSVDIDEAKSIKCGEHFLGLSDDNSILQEFAIVGEDGKPFDDTKDICVSCNMFMLDKGPQLTD